MLRDVFRGEEEVWFAQRDVRLVGYGLVWPRPVVGYQGGGTGWVEEGGICRAADRIPRSMGPGVVLDRDWRGDAIMRCSRRFATVAWTFIWETANLGEAVVGMPPHRPKHFLLHIRHPLYWVRMRCQIDTLFIDRR